MNATDLISFVPLHDDRGRTVALYYPAENVLTIRHDGATLAFPLAGAATKAMARIPIKAQIKACKSVAKR